MAGRHLDDEVPPRLQVGDAWRTSRWVPLSIDAAFPRRDVQAYTFFPSSFCSQPMNEPPTPLDSVRNSPAPRPSSRNTSATSSSPASSTSDARRRRPPLAGTSRQQLWRSEGRRGRENTSREGGMTLVGGRRRSREGAARGGREGTTEGRARRSFRTCLGQCSRVSSRSSYAFMRLLDRFE